MHWPSVLPPAVFKPFSLSYSAGSRFRTSATKLRHNHSHSILSHRFLTRPSSHRTATSSTPAHPTPTRRPPRPAPATFRTTSGARITRALRDVGEAVAVLGEVRHRVRGRVVPTPTTRKERGTSRPASLGLHGRALLASDAFPRSLGHSSSNCAHERRALLRADVRLVATSHLAIRMPPQQGYAAR